jgi:GTP-binding protein HflX
LFLDLKEAHLKAHGHLVGLKPSQLQRLSRLYQRKVPPEDLISVGLATTLCELSKELNRQIGITLDRRGRVKHVIVGNTDQLFIPDLGRARGGRSRFRGIRLIHTHLFGESITDDDLTDLIRLRLDLIAAITFNDFGKPDLLHYTHLLPQTQSDEFASTSSGYLNELQFDFVDFIRELEDEFGRMTVGALETEGQTRAIAVHVSIDHRVDPNIHLQELNELARTANVMIVDALIQKRKQYDPKYVMGRGKLDELLLLTMQLDCDLIIFDQDLTPNQVRAISAVTDVKVIDRSVLILDIFAQRAHTREGKLAVELAQHKYLLPRLAHMNTAFSRLEGGIGGRGPGETKLELDRRRARDRINWLEKSLDKARVQRESQRARRQNRDVPHVAFVGYTNAGKSTLFNCITQSDVFVENQLFATLHVTTRRLRFPHHQEVLFSDTVGFIRDLPASLEMAFKATLEELYSADVLLHVVDASDPQAQKQIQSVLTILTEMDLIGKPRVLVFNKIDLLRSDLASNLCNLHNAIGVSALDRASTRPVLDRLQYELDLELAEWVEHIDEEWDSLDIQAEDVSFVHTDLSSQNQEDSIHSEVNEATSDEATSDEVTSDEATSDEATSDEATSDEATPQALLKRVLSPDQSTWTDLDWLAYGAQYDLRQEDEKRRADEKQKKKKKDEEDDWWS